MFAPNQVFGIWLPTSICTIIVELWTFSYQGDLLWEIEQAFSATNEQKHDILCYNNGHGKKCIVIFKNFNLYRTSFEWINFHNIKWNRIALSKVKNGVCWAPYTTKPMNKCHIQGPPTKSLSF